MKRVYILCFILLISSCVYAWETYMDKCIKSWIGYPLDALIKQWGYPDEEKTITGKNIYIWIDYDYDTETTVSGLSISKTDNKGRETVISMGGEAAVHYCKKTIEVDENNIIVNGSWKGNNCPIIYGGNKLMNSQNKTR